MDVQRSAVVTGREFVQRATKQLAAGVADDLLGA